MPARRISPFLELPLLVLAAVAVAVLLKTFVVQAFFIPSASMVPTLHDGDRVPVERVGYRFGPPRRGDVIVFTRRTSEPKATLPRRAWAYVRELTGAPTDEQTHLIKRVVAVGGEVISYTGVPRVLRINGKRVPEPYRSRPDRNSSAITSATCIRMGLEVAGRRGCLVPEGAVFVMGDNRGDSEDSRVIGPVEVEDIIGRAFALVWPPAHLGGL